MIRLHYSGICLVGLTLFASCVDDNYDLSDIDTTTAIKLDGLVVPVKLNEITLNNVLDVNKDNSIIGIYTDKNGNDYYAIKKEGSFSANPVKIKELRLIDKVTVQEIKTPAISGLIENIYADFSYLIKNVDSSLLYLDYFGLKEGEYMEINLNVSPSDVLFNDLKLQIPETYVAIYKGQEYQGGIIPVKMIDGKMDNPIYVTEMKFGDVLENIDNTINITGKIGINTANIDSKGKDLTWNFSMSPFTANVVSGAINYEVEAPYINPVELNNLPDFLKDGETNLILQNPQLYLNFTSLYGAYYHSDLEILPVGEDVKETYIKMDPFKTSIVLAPDASNLNLPDLYNSPVQQDVPELQDILSGKGLPEMLNINLSNSYIDGKITKIVLGTDSGIELGGSYTFFTPLAFAEESQIIYSKTENDFFGGDVEDVEVELFQISSSVTTNLPFAVNLEVYPLDKDGNALDQASASIPANATEYELDIHFNNSFKGLDGVKFNVVANNMNGESLTPQQYLLLENIKAKITGSYVTKL